ncbi:MAG: helix-turn-helix domain-containing protein [Polyangiales bacterium]
MQTRTEQRRAASTHAPAQREPRTRRRDAEDNRARILSAAKELFATEGFEIALDAVARRAGVGRATLYRNFIDRDALASAIFEDNLRALEELSSKVQREPDGFERVVRAVIEQQIECHALVPALMHGSSAPELAALATRMTKLLRAPLATAQEHERVRADLRTSDALTVIAMLASSFIASESKRERKSRAKRAFELVLTGLKPR